MIATLVEKENVNNLHFSQERHDITSENAKEKGKKIKTRLKLATALGNLYHQKVKIIFCADEGLKEVRTTVWATTEKFILLKRGVFIPIRQIQDVIL